MGAESVSSSSISTTDLQEASTQLWTLLEPTIAYLSDVDRDTVSLAYTQMVLAHGEMRRKSGQFYIIHPVAATLKLTELKLDAATIAACLMHDVPEDTHITLREIHKEFGPEIAFLIEGVTKFSNLKYKGERRYAENLRKMFVAMSRDIRIIFIKFADRIHNLETLEHVRPDKQHRIALESIEIYAPIAERLGMSRFRGTLEDLAFPYVHPEEYKSLVVQSNVEITRRQAVTNRLVQITQKLLKDNAIPHKDIAGRPKRYYSLYKKVQSKGSLDAVYDLVALRIVAYTIDDCYRALSLIHQHFVPLYDRVKDYIARPKENGYQSIHTTVKYEQTGDIFEFQIRTAAMHDYAEYGIAAHMSYKDGVVTATDFDPMQYKWISELVQLSKKRLFVRDVDYVQKVKINLYNDRIFVMTPKGDVMDMRNGATALDFAFKVHEHVGRTASMAIINGTPAKLDTTLKNADTIEIITNKNQRPTLDWLTKVFTANAGSKIRRSLNADQLPRQK
jgi:GTP diphosphokinase / guanosine-3',5'-bis(diphosphate) 3'-diphosphatase